MSNYKYENPFTKRFVSITAIEKYSTKSFEEMRYEFYQEMQISKEPLHKQHSNKVKNPILSNLKENDANKRRHTSDTEDSILMKKRRVVENNSDDDASDDERAVNRSTKHDLSFNDQYDAVAESIGKNIKIKQYKDEKLKARRKVNQTVALEERRILSLIDGLRKEGNTFVKEGNYELAYQRYSTAITWSIKHEKFGALCHSNRALCLLKMDRVADALSDCVSAINLDSSNWKAHLRKIKCLIELGRFTEAEADAISFNNTWKIDEGRQLLSVVANKVRVADLINRADSLVNNGDKLNEALRFYNEAIDLTGNDWPLNVKRASLLFVMARYSESLLDIDEALSLESRDNSVDHVIRMRIECLVKLERFHEATKDAVELQERSPSSDNAQLSAWTREMEAKANSRNYYEVLGVTCSASVSDIKRRYRKLSLLYHPDKLVNCEAESKMIQEEKFKKLTQIYATLSDPISRRMYDIELRCRR